MFCIFLVSFLVGKNIKVIEEFLNNSRNQIKFLFKTRPIKVIGITKFLSLQK